MAGHIQTYLDTKVNILSLRFVVPFSNPELCLFQSCWNEKANAMKNKITKQNGRLCPFQYDMIANSKKENQ